MIRKWILIVAMSFCSSAFSNTYMYDYSDLWWNANESGWGVTVTHQKEIIFLTFFIYGPDGRPAWYTGQASYASQNASGQLVFTGDMFQVTGSYFAVPFNAAGTNARKVGTLTFSALAEAASLIYTIDGITVSKSLTRQTFRNNDPSGNYLGSIRQTQSGCRAPYSNGDFYVPIDFSITLNQAGMFHILVRPQSGGSCVYDGDYTQNGRLGHSKGNYNCTDGTFGTYNIDRIEANLDGLVARFSASNNYCTSITGSIGAVSK